MKTGTPAAPAITGAVPLIIDGSTARDRGASAPFADLLKPAPPKPHAGDDFLGSMRDVTDQAARFDAQGLFASAHGETSSTSALTSTIVDAVERPYLRRSLAGEPPLGALAAGRHAASYNIPQSKFSPPTAAKPGVSAQEDRGAQRPAAATASLAARSNPSGRVDAAESKTVNSAGGLRRTILLRAQSLASADYDSVKVTLSLNGRDAHVTVTLRAAATDADIERLRRDISADLRRHGVSLAKIDIRIRGGAGDHSSARER